MAGSTILATSRPGGRPPSVTILRPVAGEAVDRKVTVRWTASDPDGGDRLTYNIQYSPDMGDHWFALGVDLPGASTTPTQTMTLDLGGEAGSNGARALVRVLASDGYNTALATSAPFSVAPRAPEPSITMIVGIGVLL
ncbi:MAG: hypothetical protein M5U01_14385 [Ardenticatenaceae bacterium]|nr:hypothetical protein [Ardenticatenaceae bacterium]